MDGLSVCKSFGGLQVLNDVSFEIKEREIVALIGPNGAGKTTLFNVISGSLKPSKGRITLDGKVISGLKPYEICSLGVARTFQLVRPFPDMTVLENVTCGVLFGRNKTKSEKTAGENALPLIEFVGLSRKKDLLAKTLTLQERKALEIARGLATAPRVFLIDEFMGGLNASEISNAIKLITNIRDELGITVFWVEHIMKAVMKLADRILVIHHGNKIAEGEPKQIARNQEVIDAYLGESHLE